MTDPPKRRKNTKKHAFFRRGVFVYSFVLLECLPIKNPHTDFFLALNNHHYCIANAPYKQRKVRA